MELKTRIKLPRSEYLPAAPRPNRDKTPKGKTSQSLDNGKHLDTNKPSRSSKIPAYISKRNSQNTKVPKDNSDAKGNSVTNIKNNMAANKNLGSEEKTKCSHIPRRRPDVKECPIKESSLPENQVSGNRNSSKERHNVHRIQHLNIDADFIPDHHTETISRERPIPIFGQFYRYNHLTDWLIDSGELIEFANPVLSTPRIVEITEEINDIGTSQTHIIIDSTQYGSNTPTAPEKPLVPNNGSQGGFKTTNENVRDWLTSELEHSSRDNESGYRSMSPPSKVALSVKSQIFENSEPQQKENTNAVTKAKNMNASSSLINVTNENIKANIKEHEALIFNNFTPESYKQKVYQAIPKIDTDVKPLQTLKPDFRRNMKFPSTPNPIRHKDVAKSIPVPSYVEWPSEVVQKTTNFEGIDKLSSGADTETEPCEDLSQCTLERSELDERDHLNWFHQHSSSATLLNFSKASDTFTSGTWCSKDGTHSDTEKNWSDNYNYQDYLHHYCWKKGANKKYDDIGLKDHKGRCAKCQKYRRHSKKIYRLSHPFETIRKRITIGRLSQYRWKGVWKRTTEKWSSWTKSPRKLRKDRDRAKHCLRALNWNNADVQTTIFVYRETGTDAVTKEQKSAEITTSFKLKSWSCVCNNVEAGPSGTSFKSNRSYNKHADVGPSMFTFLCGTNSSIIKKCVTKKKLKSLEHKISNTDVRKEIVDSKEAATKAETQLNHKYTSSTPSLNNVVEIGIVTDAAPIVENKITAVTSTEISQSYPRYPRDTASYSVNTGTVLACNTTTDTKWQPSNGAESKENFSLQHDTKYKSSSYDTETHVNEVKTVSVGVWTSNQTIRHSKPNIVTDTTVPCRSIGAKEFSTMLTPKGTILSCTGTKITSVSSTSMQAQYIIPKKSAVVSTNVTVNNVDCLTARSLHLRGRTDVCLGVSAVDLLDQTSFNGGSHHTRRSVVTEFHPVYSSTSTNTATELTSKSVGKNFSGKSLERSDIKLKVDTFAQYSEFDARSETSKHTQQSACIGRSQLMSVRTLCGSGTEATTQALPELLSAETRTTPKKHMSTSAFTSRYYLGEPICTSTSVMTQREVENVNPAPILVCNCAQVGSGTDPSTQRTPAEKPVLLSSNCKPINVGVLPTEDQRKSPIQFVATTSRSCTASNNYEPNTVISSNLNAAKWIKGYMNVEKDYQSIVDISRSTVSESLKRASYVLENSKVQLQETIKLAQQQQQQQQSERDPAVNCVTSRLANASHDSLLDMLPTKEIPNKPVGEKILDCRMVDKETSDKVVKEMKETLVQASPLVRDSGFDPSPLPVIEQKSTSVLTTRCILPDPISCCINKNIGGVKAASHECIFVYHQPQCIIHRHLIDAAVQRLPSCLDTEISSAKQSSNRHSEVIIPHNGMCLQQHSKAKSLPQEISAKANTPNSGILITSNAEMSHQEVLRETLSPEEIISSKQDTPNLMSSQAGFSSEQQEQQKISCEASAKQDVRAATSSGTTQNSPDQQHRELTGEVLTPRAYKAMYETTKSMLKQGSRFQTPTHSQACGYIAHKGKEKSTTQSMQSFNACVHCCCKLHYEKKGSCTRSTQAVFEVLQICPRCCVETLEIATPKGTDTVEEYIKTYLKTSCRYYSNILTKQLDKVRDNLMKNIMPDGTPTGDIHSTSSRNLELAEACTMKPSEKRDVYCQTRELTTKISHPDKIPSLTTALSAMDFRDSQDKQDLRIMYYMLSSIEGRIRRLKNNLKCNT